MLILQLIFAHLLGDFVFQSNEIFAKKYKSWFGTFEHVLIVGLCTGLGLFPYWGDPKAWLILAIIFGVHFVQDLLKVTYDKKFNKKHDIWPYYADQIFHIALIIGLAMLFPNLEQLPMPTWFYGSYFSPVVMSYLIGLILLSYTFDVTMYQYEVRDGKKGEFQPNYPAMGMRIVSYTVFTGLFLLLSELLLST